MIWIYWLIFIIASAYFDKWRIDHNFTINHTVNAIARIIIFAVFVLLFHVRGLDLLCFAVGGFFSYWLLFNLFLNLFRRKPFDYLGDSFLDKLEAKGQTFVIWCKIVLSFGFIYGYFHTNLF